MTRDELIAFERDVAAEFNAGHIRAPIHLDGGNEDQLIEVFRDFKHGDWICGSWRQHYHCLLAGVPPEKLKAAIMKGRSITLCFPEHRVISSAIVGGIIPVALGIAWAIKRRGGGERAWCFLGDMTSTTGIYYECMNYANGFDLPIVFVVENNNKSVTTPTAEVLGLQNKLRVDIRCYNYELPYPHSGAGVRVEF